MQPTYLTFGKASLSLEPAAQDFHIEFHSRGNPTDLARIRSEAFSRGFVEDDEADPCDMQEFVGECWECAGYCTVSACATLHECTIWRVYLIHRDTLYVIEEYDMPDLSLTAYGPFSGQMEAVK